MKQKSSETTLQRVSAFYKNKKILITGHTGFKGSWLAFWLHNMGASVVGVALAPTEFQKPLYHALRIESIIRSYFLDLSTSDGLSDIITSEQPDIIFHLAAQPIVSTSYKNPVETYETNIMGTVHVLEALRYNATVVKAGVFITTDKCYKNVENTKGYTESSELGGHDPYSASKACCELIIDSYRNVYFNPLEIGIASARGGNILGGGDFGEFRLIPEIIRAIQTGNRMTIRSPKALRPWQYILDALFGYLILGVYLYEEPLKYNQAFNFSNPIIKKVTVEKLVNQFVSKLEVLDCKIHIAQSDFHETQYLQLDSSKAREQLRWKVRYDIEKTIEHTARWYSAYLRNENLCVVSKELLHLYEDLHEHIVC